MVINKEKTSFCYSIEEKCENINAELGRILTIQEKSYWR